MSDPTSRAATTNPDYDLPGNDLDPKNTTADQRKAIPLIVRVYGALCALDGVVALPLMGAYFGIMVYRLVLGQESVLIGSNLTLTVTMTAIGSVLAFVASVALIIFGWTLMKSYRRDAGRWAYALIVMTVAQILIDVMLQGIGVHLIRPMIQLGILTALSATIDPRCARSASCSVACAISRTARQPPRACSAETSRARAISSSTSSTCSGSSWSAVYSA